MGQTKYNLNTLSEKENDIIEVNKRIDYIFDRFKIIKNSVDTDIIRRDNISNQFNTLVSDFQNLIDNTYNTSQIINKAITEYSDGEQQIQNLLNGLLEINNNSCSTDMNEIKHKEVSISGGSILQNWFERLYNQFISKVTHIKKFFKDNGVCINNRDYSKTVVEDENALKSNVLDDSAIGTYNKSEPERIFRKASEKESNYYDEKRIKKIQQYIREKGINIEVTGQLDRATFQALHMIGMDELKEKGFIQEDSYRGDGLNLYKYLQNNTIIYVNPTGHYKDGISNNLGDSTSWNLYNLDESGVTFEQEQLIKDIINGIDINELSNVYYQDSNEIFVLDNILDHILSAVQSVTGKDTGVIGFIPLEVDGALIFGLSANSGYYRDTSGNTLKANNFSILTKSNVELNIGMRLIIYPYLDNANDLLGYSFFGGVEFSPGETWGIAIDFSGLTPEGLGVSGQVAPPTPSLLPIDVYMGFGYTFSETEIKLMNERWKHRMEYYYWRF